MLEVIEEYCKTLDGKTFRFPTPDHGVTVMHEFQVPGSVVQFTLQFAVNKDLLVINGWLPVVAKEAQRDEMYTLLSELYDEDSVFYGRIEIGEEGNSYYRLFQHYPTAPDAQKTFIEAIYMWARNDMVRFVAKCVMDSILRQAAPQASAAH